MQKSQESKNKRLKKKYILAILATAALPILWLLIYQIYLYHNPQLRIDYTYYKPTILPEGMIEKTPALEVWTAHPLFWFTPYNVRVNLAFTEALVRQEKADERDRYFIEDCTNTDNILGVSCTIHQTSQGTVYKQTINYSPRNLNVQPIVYDVPSVQAVSLVKNDTFIQLSVNLKERAILTDEDIATFIDSLEPTQVTNFTIKRYHPGP